MFMGNPRVEVVLPGTDSTEVTRSHDVEDTADAVDNVR